MIINSQLQFQINKLFNLNIQQQQFLENKRKSILSNEYLNLKQLFVQLDQKKKQYLVLGDFQRFILEQGKKMVSLQDLGLIYDKINIKKDEKIIFQEFFIFLVPQQNEELRKLMIRWQLDDDLEFKEQEKNIQNQDFYELIMYWIDFQKQIEKQKNIINQQFYHFNLKEIFMVLTDYGEKYIEQINFKRYFERQNIVISKQEIQCLINRLSSNNKISYEDFYNAFQLIDTLKYNEILVEDEIKNRITNTDTLQKYSLQKPQTAQRINKEKIDPIDLEMIQFVQTLNQFLKMDKELENKKREVCLQNDLNIQDLFICFDHRNQNKVNAYDITKVYNQMNLFPDKYDVYLLIKKYDDNSENALNYEQFCNIFLPNNQIQQAPQMHCISNTLKDNFGQKTMEKIKDLLILSLENVAVCEALRQKLNSRKNFDCKKIFECCVNPNTNNITQKQLQRVFQQYNLRLNQVELSLLFNRFDRNKDFIIVFTEFLYSIKPQSPKLYI